MKRTVALCLLMTLSACAAFAQATIPTVTTPVNYCEGSTPVPLSAAAGSSSDTLYWYATPSGGSGSTVVPTPPTSIPGTTLYYVSAKPAAGIESARAEISVYVNPAVPPFNLASADSTICLGESTKLFCGLGDTGRLTTVVVDNNKGRGVMFDVVAKKSINVTGFDVHTEIVATEPFNIYYKRGSMAGFESSSASWVLLGSVMISGSATGVVSVPLPVNVTVPAGQTAAFYLTNTGTANVHYHNGTGTGTVYAEDDNMKILEGVGKGFPFGATTNNRRFEGRIKYNKLAATWSTGATTDTITVSPLSTTKYWATISNAAGCQATDTMQVLVSLPAAKPAATTPVTYCQNAAAAVLTATKGSASDTLLWYTTASGGTGSKTAPVPSTTTAGTTRYYVSARSVMGCEGDRDTLKVIVNPAAAEPTGTTPVVYCQNTTATALSASTASLTDTLIWYTSATGGTGTKTAIIPSTTTAGTTSYYVSAKSKLGCEGKRDTIKVTVQPAAAKPTVSTPLRYCPGTAALPLTATKGSTTDTLLWYTSASGGTGSKTAPTPSTAISGSSFYYVSGKSNLGCEGIRAAIEVIVDPNGTIAAAPSPVNYCKGSAAVALAATPGNTTDTLFWYTAATGALTGFLTSELKPGPVSRFFLFNKSIYQRP